MADFSGVLSQNKTPEKKGDKGQSPKTPQTPRAPLTIQEIKAKMLATVEKVCFSICHLYFFGGIIG